MNVFEATLWGIGSVVAFVTVVQSVKKVVPDLPNDTAGTSACQVLAYVALLLLLRFFYFPQTRAAVIYGTRGGSWVFYPIAALLGVAIHFPADSLYELLLARWPDSTAASEIFKHFGELPLWRKVATGVGLMLTTPLIEEAFFRGALFGTLRRQHGSAVTVAATAMIFGLVHVQPQALLPIAIVGAALAFMRVASGSLWPGVVVHMTFNAVTFYAMLQGTDEAETMERMPAWWIVAGTVATAGLLLLAHRLRQREKAPEPEIESAEAES